MGGVMKIRRTERLGKYDLLVSEELNEYTNMMIMLKYIRGSQ
jgi:hypothetical protein